MPSTSTNYSFILYDQVTDAGESFLDFRTDMSGTQVGSNMNLLDTYLNNIQGSIVSIGSRVYVIPAPLTKTGANQFIATLSSMPASPYPTGTLLSIVPDTNNDGTTLLNINGDGNVTIVKKNAAGISINLENEDLLINHHYLIEYDGSNWVWVNATSYDQIIVPGNSGDIIAISSGSGLISSGFSISVPGTSGNILIDDGNDWISASALPVGMKASGSDLTTGTDDIKFVTAKAIKDSANVPSVAPGTSGNVLTSDGTAWQSAAPAEKETVYFQVVDADETTPNDTGVGNFTIPPLLDDYDITQIEAYVYTVSSSGNITVQVRNVTTSQNILSTVATIEAGDFNSTTATTRSVVNSSYKTVSVGDIIRIDATYTGASALGLDVSISMEK